MKIPFISTPDTPISVSTQNELPLADILHDIVIYKDGGAALIMESSSLNFGLLSDREQQAVIAAYAALLNSFTFTVQIVVRSQRKDISNYLKYLDKTYKESGNTKLKDIMQDYKRFIKEAITKKNVLSKKFYIVIPLSSLELGVTKSFLATTRRKGPLPFTKDYVLKKAVTILYPKRDHLMRQAGRLGISLKQLKNQELVALFYDIYNQEPPGSKSEYEIVEEHEQENKPKQQAREKQKIGS